MNLKLATVASILSFTAVSFAAEPAVETTAPVADAAVDVTTPASAEAPVVAAEPAAPVVDVSEPAAPSAEPVAESVAAPAAEPVVTEDDSAPVAVRGAEGVAEPAVAPAEPVATNGGDVAVAPSAVRGADKSADDPQATLYYERIVMDENGNPVRMVYVARGSSSEEDAKALKAYEMKFKIGAHASVGSYYLSSNSWSGDEYDGMSWRAGLMTIIPLNQYTIGLKLGVLYNQSEASESYPYRDENGYDIPVSFSFEQASIDVPILFTFKGAGSRFYFDIGAQVSVPVKDELTLSYTKANGEKYKGTGDMIDDGYRRSMDWNMIVGFSIMANNYLSLDVSADVGMSDLYKGYRDFMDLDLSASTFRVGLTVYPF